MRDVTDLEVFIQLNLTIHIGVDFAQNFVKFLTGYFFISEELRRIKKYILSIFSIYLQIILQLHLSIVIEFNIIQQIVHFILVHYI